MAKSTRPPKAQAGSPPESLKDIIHRQTTLIESAKADLEEVKHDQNVLREQNDRLHEEVKALRMNRPIDI
ncbi:uncharacterized protein N7479_000114 [Penicillium vulpinum]|uniref:uncharacterized protein n=1 Tax=Penicillium vulpinum TaxID=29845 RepID=UPI002548D05D|nr:uncharacterized protein N7479_000114 [Penicillium vulpinum]KAJ5970196.1 hypothetical protein N7479_000114 [Penicillium vulpinum]